MKLNNRKDLIIALIKDDLINSKLVNSLNEIGLEADSYNLHASTTIMNLMNIKAPPLRWEEIHDGYLDRTKKITQIDIQESPTLVDALAVEIYRYLKKSKEEEQEFNSDRIS
jgi:hypothetical protein